MTAYMEHKDLANEIIAPARARDIADNVRRVLDRVATAESAAGREPGSVRLLAATKTRDVGEIMAAIDAGVRMIGENRPQEMQVKAPGLARLAAERGFALGACESAASRDSGHIPFHLIGQLQSNKIGKVLPAADSPAAPFREAAPSACCWRSTSLGRRASRAARPAMPSIWRSASALWAVCGCRA